MTVIWQRLDNVPHLKGKNAPQQPTPIQFVLFFCPLSQKGHGTKSAALTSTTP
jgi:hypothetical protein